MKNSMMKKSEIVCEVCKDLIPLVQDHVASKQSEELVRDHIKKCESCRQEFDESEAIVMPVPELEGRKLIKQVRHYSIAVGIFILLLGCLFGVMTANNEYVFYNFIIMPLVGCLAVILFRKKSILVIAFVFVMTYIISWIQEGISSALFFPICFLILMSVGVVIGIFTRNAWIKQNKIPVRIISGMVALILFSGVLVVTNATVGNPVSALIANYKINEYINKEYGNTEELDYKTTFAKYNFKSGGYYKIIQSKTSADTRFSIEISKNGTIRDSYDSDVTSNWNTLLRMENLAREEIRKSIEAKYGKVYEDISFTMDESEVDGKIASESLSKDMKFELNQLPLPGELSVVVETKERTIEVCINHLKALKSTMDEMGVKIDYYSVDLMPLLDEENKLEGEKHFSLYKVPASAIENEDSVDKFEVYLVK